MMPPTAMTSTSRTSSSSDVTWLFTTAADGNLATQVGDDAPGVNESRRRLSERVGRPIIWMNQVHGNHVEIIRGRPDTPLTADAQVTDSTELALGVLVADCMPVLLHSNSAVAVVHVGRRGLLNEVAIRTVEAMRSAMGADDIVAQIGPSICGRCYEVPQQMHDDIVRRWPSASARTAVGTTGVDLRAGLVEQLRSLDVAAALDPRCTREDPDLFSHRRAPGRGRFAGVIWR